MIDRLMNDVMVDEDSSIFMCGGTSERWYIRPVCVKVYDFGC